MLGARPSILLCSTALLGACSNGGDAQQQTAALYTVSRGPLAIRVVEAGELKAATETMIRSEVEGMVTIIYLIEEGTEVKQGDRLIELDVSNLIDRKASKEIDLARAEASRVQAEQDLAIQLKEIVASEEAALSKLTIAEMEMEKFIGHLPTSSANTMKATNADMLEDLGILIAERQLNDLVTKVREDLIGDARYEKAELGKMAQDVLSQIDEVLLMEADLKIKEEEYAQSKRLFAKEFVTRSDLERDEYRYQSQLSKVTLAFNELEILINYNLKKSKIELSQNLRNAGIELERVIANNLARKAREEAELRSKQAEYGLAKERYQNLVYQIEHATIHAPTDGLVVYAAKGMGHRREVIEEGSRVHHRQALIVLPDASKIMAVIRIQEGDMQKVVPGQRATIKIDAFKDRVLTGKVQRVAPLPDSRSRYENKDLKVYVTEVLLDGINEVLRPGMSATVSLEIADLENALRVPLEAINVQGVANYVWKASPQGPQALEVEIGAISLSHVEVKSGLEQGDQVYLTPPAGMVAPKFAQPADIRPATIAEIEQAQQEFDSSTSVSNGTGDASAQLIEALKKKFPDRTDLQNSRGLMRAMRDPEIQAVLKDDPALQQMVDRVRESFMERMRNRGGDAEAMGERRGGRSGRRGGGRD